ncbi:hypothetical protein EAF00_007821 [Botryotinia globosa]|nr:hypothetical protein EAF00_007821 [Botryotinia globosa]
MIWIRNTHAWRDSAFDAAVRWRGRQETVPHDKGFGLRGLWLPNVEMPNTDKCSYETSVAELYTAFTNDIILDENSLALLALDPRIERGKRTSIIPNWATDVNNSVEYGVDTYYRRWGDKQIYDACGENRLDKQALIDATADPNHHFNVLGLTGIMIDTMNILACLSLANEYFETIPDVVISPMLRDWMDTAAAVTERVTSATRLSTGSSSAMPCEIMNRSSEDGPTRMTCVRWPTLFGMEPEKTNG